LTGFFVVMLLYWIGIQISGIKDLPINLFYSFSTAVLAFFGGIFGLFVSKNWGSTKSSVGKAVLFMSAGTISWSLGNFVWSFYNFILSVEMPYPSPADLGYTLAIPLWIIGVTFLSEATGARFSLKKMRGRFVLILFPILAALLSYYFLFVIARDSTIDLEGGLLKVLLDFYYPISDFVILTVSFIMFGLSLKYLGGRFRLPVYTILIGFIFMFLADFLFSYTTTIETYYNGNFPDLLFAVAMYVISLGVCSLDISDGNYSER
jgi:hypothetical protein